MENIDNIDVLCVDDSINDNEISICESEPDDTPQSITIDICNGSPLNVDNFLVLHYNINSITAEGRLDELSFVTSTLKADILICTESKLCEIIPDNIITISGYHNPV